MGGLFDVYCSIMYGLNKRTMVTKCNEVNDQDYIFTYINDN